VAKFKGSSQKVRRSQVSLKAEADAPGWTDAGSRTVRARGVLAIAGDDFARNARIFQLAIIEPDCVAAQPLGAA
jgi:hypothetical protein